jgi:hypothetical protein
VWSVQTQRQRYFILKGNLLFYYKCLKDRTKDPIGFICLEGYTVALEEGVKCAWWVLLEQTDRQMTIRLFVVY